MKNLHQGKEASGSLTRVLKCVFEDTQFSQRKGAAGVMFDAFGQPLIIDKAGRLFSANDKQIVFMLGPIRIEKNNT